MGGAAVPSFSAMTTLPQHVAKLDKAPNTKDVPKIRKQQLGSMIVQLVLSDS